MEKGGCGATLAVRAGWYFYAYTRRGLRGIDGEVSGRGTYLGKGAFGEDCQFGGMQVGVWEARRLASRR
jgi:hypothetical protein